MMPQTTQAGINDIKSTCVNLVQQLYEILIKVIKGFFPVTLIRFCAWGLISSSLSYSPNSVVVLTCLNMTIDFSFNLLAFEFSLLPNNRLKLIRYDSKALVLSGTHSSETS